MLWILSWCFLGGILILLVVEIYPLSTKERWNSFQVIAIGFLSTAGAIAILSALSFFLFELGLWVPIVPASLGLLLTSGGVIVTYVYVGNKG
jgi:CHASE2 domain-containing sensor protein